MWLCQVEYANPKKHFVSRKSQKTAETPSDTDCARTMADVAGPLQDPDAREHCSAACERSCAASCVAKTRPPHTARAHRLACPRAQGRAASSTGAHEFARCNGWNMHIKGVPTCSGGQEGRAAQRDAKRGMRRDNVVATCRFGSLLLVAAYVCVHTCVSLLLQQYGPVRGGGRATDPRTARKTSTCAGSRP